MRHSLISPLAVLGLLASTACSGGSDPATPTTPVSAVPAPAPTASAPQSEVDVVYGSGLTNGSSKTLLLDVYQSGETCALARPAVILIHGGGFRTGSKSSGGFPNIAEALADQGYVAISINYRLEGDDPVPSAEFTPYLNAFITGGGGAGVPGLVQIANNISSAVEDAVTAIRWIETNATERCIDVDRMALWGSSAGAVIAVNAAYAMDDFSINVRKPAVVIDYWGQLIFDETIEANDPPLLILHGDEEPTGRFWMRPMPFSRRICPTVRRNMRRAQCRCQGDNKKPPDHSAGFSIRISNPDLVFSRLQDLPTAIHTSLQIDMVRTTKLTRVLVFDKRIAFQAVMRTAHATA